MADHRANRLPAALRLAVDAIDDRKGIKLQVIDLRGLSDAADYFVIASGTSDAHVRGIADGVVRAMDAAGLPAHHVEGVQGGRWVLLDFVDLVVHLFHPETRAFYQLERLWQDAPTLLSDL
ncbi:MAG TPA: ribosome silencing factor [Gemmatimonadales bacterium]